MRCTILTELGRIDTDDALVRMARILCAQKLTTAAAIALIRRYRHGDKPLNLV